MKKNTSNLNMPSLSWEESLRKSQNTFFVSFLFGIPLCYLSMGGLLMLPELPIPSIANILIQLVLSIIIISINYRLYISGFQRLLRLKPNMDSLIGIGTLAALFYSTSTFILLLKTSSHQLQIATYFESIGLILILISFGKYLEKRNCGKTGMAIKKLTALKPLQSLVLQSNEEVTVSVATIKEGDIVIVKPGDRIPSDGKVTLGASTIDESAITGESTLVIKNIGDFVIEGTLNKTNIFQFTATKVGDEASLTKVIKSMTEAFASRKPAELLANKLAFYFLPFLFAIVLLTFLAWILLGFDLLLALSVATSVLIVACPCALGLAESTAFMMGMNLAAKKGVLIKNSKALAVAHKIDTIIFDKTGTLTKGKPEVIEVCNVDFTEKETLKIAVSLANHSSHPISKAITAFGKIEGIVPIALSNFKETKGMGLEAEHATFGGKFYLANTQFLQEKGLELPPRAEKILDDFSRQGVSPILVAKETTSADIVGIIGIMDNVKNEALLAISTLQELEKRIMIFSGDKKSITQTIGQKLAVEEIFAPVSPEGKALKIKELQSEGRVVAMVGDGMNDTPAFAQANVGISLGSGTNIALEASDIVLVNNNLSDVLTSIEVSKYTLRKIKQNLFWTFFYNLLGVSIATGIFYSFNGLLLNSTIVTLAILFSVASVFINSLLMGLHKGNYAKIISENTPDRKEL